MAHHPSTRSTPAPDATGNVVSLLLLTFLVVIFLGLIGWTVYSHEQHVRTPVATTTNTSTRVTSTLRSCPYASWKVATLRNEHASFCYPGTWTVRDDSSQASDAVSITGPDAFSISISTGGLGHPSNDGPTTVRAAVPVTFLGKPGYLDYTSYGSDSLVDVVSVSQSQTNFLDTFPSRAAGLNATPTGNFMIIANYVSGNSYGEPLNQAEADPNYQVVQHLVESVTY